MKIHISRDGHDVGSFDLEQLQDAVEAGTVFATDLAWMEGLEDWVPLSTIVDINIEPGHTPSASAPIAQAMPPSVPSVKKPRFKVVAVAVAASFLLIVLIGAISGIAESHSRASGIAQSRPDTPGSAEAASPDAMPEPIALLQTVYSDDIEKALEAARKFVVGTWTFTGEGYVYVEYEEGNAFRPKQQHGWLKWVIREDGTMLRYRAPVVADDWGQPTTLKWDIKTGKFSDTGKRYYQLVMESGDLQGSMEKLAGSAAFIRQDGKLICKIYSDLTIGLERGDRFPFSK